MKTKITLFVKDLSVRWARVSWYCSNFRWSLKLSCELIIHFHIYHHDLASFFFSDCCSWPFNLDTTIATMTPPPRAAGPRAAMEIYIRKKICPFPWATLATTNARVFSLRALTRALWYHRLTLCSAHNNNKRGLSIISDARSRVKHILRQITY